MLLLKNDIKYYDIDHNLQTIFCCFHIFWNLGFTNILFKNSLIATIFIQNGIYSDYQKILNLLKITIYKIFNFVNTINFVGYIYGFLFFTE